MSHITGKLALVALALGAGACTSPPSSKPASPLTLDRASNETGAVREAAGPAPTFALGSTQWTVDLRGAAVSSQGSGALRLADDRRTFWIARYPDGAGPINLGNARSIIVSDPEPTVLFQQGRTEDVAFELVVQGPGSLRGERLIDDPDGTGATVDCSFELAQHDEPAWRSALDVCRSLRPAP